MNEEGCRKDNGRGFDGSSVPLVYIVILYFKSAPIVLLFVIPTNPVNSSFFQLMKKDATKIMVGVSMAVIYLFCIP